MKGFDIFKKIKEVIPGQSIFITSTGVLQELKSINKREIGLVLKIIDNMKKKGLLKIIDSSRYVDKWLVDYVGNMNDVDKTNFIVCTNDRELRRKLKHNGIRIISLKNESIISFV
ncbi:hypothetical protein J7J90_04300 [Candidatus Micrarchaeota archaeon]|nr:hypothetical protein [Candidatus Micrarchaeota archaeon]